MKKNTLLFIFSVIISTFIFAQQTEKRLALIVGNSAYAGGCALKNPVNDANLMAATLTTLGFTVIKRVNVRKADLEKVIYEFSKKLKDYDVALFYYAGHGIQVDGKNYLIPIDAKLNDKTAVRFEAVSINYVIDEFEYYPDNTNIVILDACRDNPFKMWSRGNSRGFKAIPPASGTIIAFATSEGATAADNSSSANGLYTTHLVRQLKIPQSIESAFKKTRIAVQRASNGKQSPQEWTKLTGDFYFAKQKKSENANTPTIGNVESTAIYGSINLNTEISGTLYIDGNIIGSVNANTKVPINKIVTGNRKIEILGAETWTGTVNIYKNQTTIVTAKSIKKSFDLPKQLTDNRDGKTYKIVEIGNQVWMAENLAYYTSNGCWAYDNKQSNVNKYGYLYNWETAKKVCPDGWHLPNDNEWKKLEMYLGMSQADADDTDYRGINIGSKLASNSSVWNSGSLIRNSEIGTSGFSAFPGGYRSSSGNFNYIGSYGLWWGSTASSSDYAWSRRLGYNYSKVSRSTDSKAYGFSVRCVRD